MEYDDNVKELVILRLRAIPSNLKISIGNFGEFTKDELIREVEKESPAGRAAIRMELLFLREMPSISRRVSEAEKEL